MPSADYWIKKLNLQPHPEGGHYRESYRSSGIIEAPGLPNYFGSRNFATTIYYLLKGDEFSAFHRLKSDEVWHYYDGCSLNFQIIQKDGAILTKVLGKNIEDGESLQQVIPADHWFAATPTDKGSFSLVGCAMAPGFDINDFEMGLKEELIKQFPQHEELIQLLTNT
jgi:predicted cupin superfamily sugar epimerase